MKSGRTWLVIGLCLMGISYMCNLLMYFFPVLLIHIGWYIGHIPNNLGFIFLCCAGIAFLVWNFQAAKNTLVVVGISGIHVIAFFLFWAAVLHTLAGVLVGIMLPQAITWGVIGSLSLVIGCIRSYKERQDKKRRRIR